MAETLHAHDAVVRDAVERHGRYVFDTGSDARRAALSNPTDAVDVAIESQERLRDDETSDSALRMVLPLRRSPTRAGAIRATG